MYIFSQNVGGLASQEIIGGQQLNLRSSIFQRTSFYGGVFSGRTNEYGCFLKWWYPHFTPQVLIIFSRKNHRFDGETHHFRKPPKKEISQETKNKKPPSKNQQSSKISWTNIPIGSMYGIYNYIWVIFMVNVGKYTIHGSYGIGLIFLYRNNEQTPNTKSQCRSRVFEFLGVRTLPSLPNPVNGGDMASFPGERGHDDSKFGWATEKQNGLALLSTESWLFFLSSFSLYIMVCLWNNPHITG